MKTKPAILDQNELDLLSKEALEILDILDQIESHTAALRKKLMPELKSKDNAVKLELDEVE